jgi:DNA adenine methylase
LGIEKLAAPFPYFGAKSRVADEVWRRFGQTPNFVDPFCGSASILLARPDWTPDRKWTETINDIDGMVCNFYRATRMAPNDVAYWANNPPIESDVHARNIWLVEHRAELTERLEGDADYFDVKAAGWWVWGLASFIGGGFANGNGPWHSVDGRLIEDKSGEPNGISRRIMHLGDNGRGVNRRSLHEGHYLSDGTPSKLDNLIGSLSNRLARVRITCGDWKRVTTKAVTSRFGLTSIFLDPPYTKRLTNGSVVYGKDGTGLEGEVWEYALQTGDDPSYKIAVCGYEGEYDFPDTWEVLEWKAAGGYSSLGDGEGKELATKERIWFSPHCLK